MNKDYLLAKIWQFNLKISRNYLINHKNTHMYRHRPPDCIFCYIISKNWFVRDNVTRESSHRNMVIFVHWRNENRNMIFKLYNIFIEYSFTIWKYHLEWLWTMWTIEFQGKIYFINVVTAYVTSLHTLLKAHCNGKCPVFI